MVRHFRRRRYSTDIRRRGSREDRPLRALARGPRRPGDRRRDGGGRRRAVPDGQGAGRPRGVQGGGVVKIWGYQALDDGREVMILQEIENELSAREWIDHPDAAAEWISKARFGAYPTQFVGRFAHLMSIGERV